MRVNTALVRYRGGFRERANSAGVTADGVIEGFLDYGEDTAGQADRQADATLARYATERWTLRPRVTETGVDDVFFDDVALGDTVTVPDQDGSPSALQVFGAMLGEDEAGNRLLVPDLGVPIASYDERAAQTNRAFSAGTLAGRDPQARPQGPPTTPPGAVPKHPAGPVVTVYGAFSSTTFDDDTDDIDAAGSYTLKWAGAAAGGLSLSGDGAEVGFPEPGLYLASVTFEIQRMSGDTSVEPVMLSRFHESGSAVLVGGAVNESLDGVYLEGDPGNGLYGRSVTAQVLADAGASIEFRFTFDLDSGSPDFEFSAAEMIVAKVAGV